ncbi:hypothetical protein LINPERHAP1_LOCUS37417 [Linum perenne]
MMQQQQQRLKQQQIMSMMQYHPAAYLAAPQFACLFLFRGLGLELRAPK